MHSPASDDRRPPASHAILALSPFHTGSHRAFLEGWQAASRHRFTLCGLPGRHWKWRMRHSALTLAHRAGQLADDGQCWDCVIATDMLNLPEWLGFAAAIQPRMASLPAAVYFHESQFTYPNRSSGSSAAERDLHFAYTNFLSAVAAHSVWFNSASHRDAFLSALPQLLRRMPDCRHRDQVARIERKARVLYPGITRAGVSRELSSERELPARHRGRSPLRIVWAARWEHDKGPETLFSALRILREWDVPFRLSVLGESYDRVPECFSAARNEFADAIDHWGYVHDRRDFQAILAEQDVVVSTARHEFFGIAILEAAAAGCVPVLPQRLAYPELFAEIPEVFYGQTARDLAVHLRDCVSRTDDSAQWEALQSRTRELACRFDWACTAPALDLAVDALVTMDRRPS